MVCGGEDRCKKRRKTGGSEMKRRWRKGRGKKKAIAMFPGMGIRGLSLCEGEKRQDESWEGNVTR